MKNKKGFTLIELLSVIIILAVIALIATPIVLNVIDNARISANKDSVYGLLDSAKLYYAESLLDENKTLSGNILDKINIRGRKPDSGFIYINEVGEVNISVMYDKICYMKDYEETDLRVKKVSKSSECNIESTIVIKVLSKKVSDKVKIEITYGDLSVKQYKIGNGSWNNYEGEFEVTSYDYVENNNLVDGKAIVYAKGIDELGNESTKEKEITLLDIDIPNKPIIKLSNGYPLLTATKIENGDITTITYDSRSDIKNYYKIDDGEWIEYREGINITGSEIYAKSVKESGLEVITSKKISESEITDAITKEAYDGDLNTYQKTDVHKNRTYKMYVDSSIWNKKILINMTANLYSRYNISFIKENSDVIESFDVVNESINKKYTIPSDTYLINISYTDGDGGSAYIYEIRPVDEIPPVISASVYNSEASIIMTDNVGLVAYAITQDEEEPNWISMESTIDKSTTISGMSNSIYYVWAKDLDDNISKISVKCNNQCKVYRKYQNGDIVYFNPNLNKKCTIEEAKNNLENGMLTGVKTGCMGWYIVNDKGENYQSVNLILDHNTTALTTWLNRLTILKDDTSTWNSSIYSRLITADELATITGNTNFKSSTASVDNWFYFDSNNQILTSSKQSPSKYSWLFDYTAGCTNYGCLAEENTNSGYWTESLVKNGSFANMASWYVNFPGGIGINNIDNGSYAGIRPVIKISKLVLE